MKVLVVCQHYAPEPFQVTEICEDLVRRGHQVTAVVGLPNYPSGIVPKEYKWFRKRREYQNGVEIRRCFEIGRKNTKIGLAINYVSYMISASWKVLFLKRDFDVVYAYSTSPVLMSFPASLLRCVCKKKLMIYVLDIWPACLAAMNVYEGSWLYAVMKRVSKWIYQRADVLTYSSKRFQGYLERVHGIRVSDEDYLPQFANDLFSLSPQSGKDEVLNLVFAGNIGKMQDIQTFIRAADILRNEPIRWHILGDGSDFEACVALTKTLALEGIMTFYGRLPLEDLPHYYSMADAMLVSMRNNISVNDTLPGKVQGYMAVGKPILGSIMGETPYILEQAQCGLCAPAENPEAFAEIVRQFLILPSREQMGKNARDYYENHFTKTHHMDRLELLLKKMAKAEVIP